MKRHFNCKFDIATEKNIIAFYQKGNLAKTAREFDCSNGAIRNVLLAYNIRIKNQSEGMEGLQNAKKHTVDETFFDKIDTQIKAYLFGLFCSDGWVYQKGTDYRIGFASIDVELLELIKDEMNASYPINKRETIGKPIYEIQITNKILCLSIQKLGCIQRKSLTLDYPSCIPVGLNSHFLRGIYDGDGSFTIKTEYRKTKPNKNYLYISLCGALPIITKVCSLLATRVELPSKNPKKTGSIFAVEYACSNAFKLRDYLYNDSKYFLKRKKEVAFSDSLDSVKQSVKFDNIGKD